MASGLLGAAHRSWSQAEDHLGLRLAVALWSLGEPRGGHPCVLQEATLDSPGPVSHVKTHGGGVVGSSRGAISPFP